MANVQRTPELNPWNPYHNRMNSYTGRVYERPLAMLGSWSNAILRSNPQCRRNINAERLGIPFHSYRSNVSLERLSVSPVDRLLNSQRVQSNQSPGEQFHRSSGRHITRNPAIVENVIEISSDEETEFPASNQQPDIILDRNRRNSQPVYLLRNENESNRPYLINEFHEPRTDDKSPYRRMSNEQIGWDTSHMVNADHMFSPRSHHAQDAQNLSNRPSIERQRSESNERSPSPPIPPENKQLVKCDLSSSQETVVIPPENQCPSGYHWDTNGIQDVRSVPVGKTLKRARQSPQAGNNKVFLTNANSMHDTDSVERNQIVNRIRRNDRVQESGQSSDNETKPNVREIERNVDSSNLNQNENGDGNEDHKRSITKVKHEVKNEPTISGETLNTEEAETTTKEDSRPPLKTIKKE